MSAQAVNQFQSLDRNFKKAIKISLGLHIALMVFLTLKVYLIPDQALDYESSLRVDIVALPQKQLEQMIQQQSAPAKPTPAPKAEPVKKESTKKASKPVEDVVILKPKKSAKAEKNEKVEKVDTKKQQEALNRLKQMSALENLEDSMKEDRSKATAAASKQVFAGNQIATGSDLKGLSKIQHDAYISQVERHIKNNWALPQWLANKKLRAQVRVRIDSQGRVIGKELVRSSGNSSFDDVALETIDNSSPVPAPPEKLARILANEGILFGFPD